MDTENESYKRKYRKLSNQNIQNASETSQIFKHNSIYKLYNKFSKLSWQKH